MNNYSAISNYIVYDGKGITPKYVDRSSIIVLNQKCVSNHQIDYSLAQYTDDSQNILNSKFLRLGDIVINSTGTGTAGRSALVTYIPTGKKVITDSHILILRCASEDISACLSYQLYSREDLLMSFMTGSSGQSEFDKVRLFDLQLMVIDDPVKLKNNLSLLFNIDKKIQTNNEVNIKLEEIAKTIFDDWFVQFDFPNENGQPYKSSDRKMVWNDELKRKIPENWEVLSLSNLIYESKNGDWGSESISEESTKCFCIRGADINGLNGIENFNPPVRYIDKSHSNRLLKADDLIIEISGGSPTQSTGRMAHISQDVLARLDNKVVCSNFCKAISLNKTKLSYIISRYWARLYVSGTFFNHEGKTSGIKNLLFDQLAKDVKIALPTDENLINEYYELEKSIDKQKQNILVQNKELIKLRDWLLPMLMNGQVKVSDK
jgi:type I restriction enzyme S subunit